MKIRMEREEDCLLPAYPIKVVENYGQSQDGVLWPASMKFVVRDVYNVLGCLCSIHFFYLV